MLATQETPSDPDKELPPVPAILGSAHLHAIAGFGVGMAHTQFRNLELEQENEGVSVFAEVQASSAFESVFRTVASNNPRAFDFSGGQPLESDERLMLRKQILSAIEFKILVLYCLRRHNPQDIKFTVGDQGIMAKVAIKLDYGMK